MIDPIADFLARQPTMRPRWRTLLRLSLINARERRLAPHPMRQVGRLAGAWLVLGWAVWAGALFGLGRLKGWW